MKRRSFLTLSSAACLSAALPGCLRPNPLPLQVATTLWIGQEPLYLAEKLGYYGDAPIQRLDYPSYLETMRDYRNGEVEVAVVSLSESIELLQTNPDTRIFLVLDFSHGNDVILSHPNIKTLSALRGKKVGLDASAFEYHLLYRGLASAQLLPTEVQIFNIGLEEQEQAFKQRRVDALVTYDPIRSNLLNSGASLLFDSRQIPYEIADVLVSRASTIERRADNIQALVDGWFKAIAHLQTHPQDSAQIMASRESMTPEAFLESLQLLQIPTRSQNQNLLSRSDPTLLKSTQKLMETLLEKKFLQQPLNLDQIFTDQFVRPTQAS
jgi:NitT/TauT family transport system substrate-binding protein